MASRPEYPRKAWIDTIDKGQPGHSVIWYQLRSDHPHDNALIGEYPDEQEAQDAMRRYTDPSLS